MTQSYHNKKQTAQMASALDISPRFAQKQNLNILELGNIALLQFKRVRLFDRAEALRVDRDMDQLRALMTDLRALEFKMQEWWKFTPTAQKHTWWCRMPHCKCDYNVNRTLVPRGEPQEINPECPLHGKDTGFSLEKGVDNSVKI